MPPPPPLPPLLEPPPPLEPHRVDPCIMVLARAG